MQLLLRNVFDISAINDVVILIRLRDLSFMTVFLWFLYVIFIYRGYRILNTFSGIIWAFLAIIVLNCGVGYIKFDQPLLLGFQVQRDIFAGLWMFLAINTLVYRGKFEKKEI